MNAFVTCAAIGLYCITSFTPGQESIPDAEVVNDNTPLVAQPEHDALAVADLLYQQAQTQKNNPQEHQRLLELCVNRYLEVERSFPQSPNAPVALYRAATCLEALNRKADARQCLERIMLYNNPDLKSSAAYWLANNALANNQNTKAIQYYQQVIHLAVHPKLVVEAQYRLARLFLTDGDPESAATLFSAILGNPAADPVFAHAARLGYASVCEELGRLGEAYKEYTTLINTSGVNLAMRNTALLQAAGLATKLKKTDDAKKWYNALIQEGAAPNMAPNMRLNFFIGLYHIGKYTELVTQYQRCKTQSWGTPQEHVRCLQLVGQTEFKLKHYQQAAEYFLEAEKLVPYTQQAMQASYSRLLCYKELNQADIPQRAQHFLNHYTKAFPDSELHDMVRLVAADSLFSTNPAIAAQFYAGIDFNKIAPSQRPDILYKAAWAIAQAGNRGKAADLLSVFIQEYPKDTRIPQAYVMRGQMLANVGNEAQALQDFDRVIARWPKLPATAVAWQGAARIYVARQDPANMVKYYKGLIENFPQTAPAALAEAHFQIGRAAFDRADFQESQSHLSEAKTLDPQKYGEQVNVLTVLSYHKLQDAAKLKIALETLEKENPAAAERVPPVIPAWLGLQAYGMKDLETADKYLSRAAQNDQQGNVKKVIWRTLVKVQLALQKYPQALVAANNFLKEEEQPYRKADALLDKASILLGLDRYTEAKKTAEEALALGVEGPLMASLRLVLGDIAYKEKKFDEAAKHYGITAELFVNDNELKPKALYKASQALEQAGRPLESAQYKTQLHKDFPDWRPEPAAGNLAAPAGNN